MNFRGKIREKKEWIEKNLGLTIIATVVSIFFILLFIRMFIKLLPIIGIGIVAFIIYKLYKGGYLQ